MAQLHLVPADILQTVFLFVATDRSLGPPSGILPLILANRRMHSVLCACRAENAHIYYTLFLHLFDVEAPRRRMGRHFATASCCSSELRKRFACIQRVRDHPRRQYVDQGLLTEDLCRCYFMLLEHDDKNAILLFHTAKFPTFIVDLAQEYLSDDWLSRMPSSPLLSFLVWNLWLVSSHSMWPVLLEVTFELLVDLLLREDPQIVTKLQQGLLPCAISGWIFSDYPPAISPPPSDFSRAAVPAPRLSYTINLFSKDISFVAPPPTPAAILAFCPRADASLVRLSQSTAAAANPSLAPPVQNVSRSERFLASSVANLLQEVPHTLISELEDHRQPSTRFDDDWVRLQVTHPGPEYALSPPMTIDIRRLLTVISGIWEGRMEYPTYSQYMGLREIGTPLISAFKHLFIASLPLIYRLRVYYCVEESLKLRVPDGRDSILHAFLPREEEMDITVTNAGDLRIWDRIQRTHARYHRYDPIGGIPNDVDILDVILIGTNLSPNAGLDAEYIGRLNTTDGLLVLLRNAPQHGRELLRGFVHHNQNFVGRWRTTASPADANNWEGPFIMGRRSEDTVII